MNAIMGVYKITNKYNGRMYIGSSIDILTRWKQHIEALTNGTHHSYKLQKDWDIYGIVNFTFQVIDVIKDRTQLRIVEQRWMDSTQCYVGNIGYNVSTSSTCKSSTKHAIPKRTITNPFYTNSGD